jgi:uncharacterized membrane protein
MKTKIFLIVILSLITLKAQSVLTLGIGTTLVVGAGADLCAGSIAGSGLLSGNGTFCGSPTEVESESDKVLPTEYALDQNYPNPFNPITKISWQSPVSGHQTLKIYDVLGNEVTTLVDEYREAGSYEINFGASQLSSGIYFYKLQAGNFLEVKKMQLMK